MNVATTRGKRLGVGVKRLDPGQAKPLDQMVAMKFLRRGTGESSEASKRFLREAKAVVKLRNEHVALLIAQALNVLH